jgi:hypothetical protein
MNDKFDELAKEMARSVTRRGALKKFGVGLAGAVFALMGLASKAENPRRPYRCSCKQGWPYACLDRYGYGTDGYNCALYCSSFCERKSGV